jgi:death-on-curing protein
MLSSRRRRRRGRQGVKANYAGAAGVRDRGLVESALARARSGYYGSLSEQAAALLQSFAMNHGFVDGNKRVAWASSLVFLRMNGLA